MFYGATYQNYLYLSNKTLHLFQGMCTLFYPIGTQNETISSEIIRDIYLICKHYLTSKSKTLYDPIGTQKNVFSEVIRNIYLIFKHNLASKSKLYTTRLEHKKKPYLLRNDVYVDCFISFRCINTVF